MFNPAGELRWLEVGPFGVLMCYCCIGFKLYHDDEVGNPKAAAKQ